MSESKSTKTLCAFPGCDRPVLAKGLCRPHYKQSWNGKPLTALRTSKRIDRICPVCNNPFVTWPFRTRTDRGKFCSKACATIAQSIPLAVRFWSFVNKTDSCWLWTGAHGAYGLINRHSRTKTLLAHRLSWEIANGPIPEGAFVLHNCPNGEDNPLCVRPSHLWLGTPLDNALDMIAKGRSKPPRGELNGSAKLTWEIVRGIRARHALGGISLGALAAEFHVTTSTIWHIVQKMTWRE